MKKVLYGLNIVPLIINSENLLMNKLEILAPQNFFASVDSGRLPNDILKGLSSIHIEALSPLKALFDLLYLSGYSIFE